MPVRMPVNYSNIITIYQSINSDFAKISAGKNADVFAAIKYVSKIMFFTFWFTFVRICGENRCKFEVC